MGVRGRLKLLVEAESLFNDGTAAVAFAVALAALGGGGLRGSTILASFATTIFGGILCGAVVGGGILALAGPTEDHLVELTFTTAAAYGSFWLAEHFQVSGILATLTAGLLVGNVGHLGALTDRGREAMLSFWEYMAFVANSLIFLLIGFAEAHHAFRTVWREELIAIGLVLAGRLLSVYGCCALFQRSANRVTWPHQHILVWGGLRGALALALALGLPPETPDRDDIITVAFAVVAFSVIVQGLTMTPLLRRLGELPPREQAKIG